MARTRAENKEESMEYILILAELENTWSVEKVRRRKRSVADKL
jgi:hypothetical protein|tara:strand:- start:402 stop:530 length:129 start_codon:yes stop_codon:yes gene_type:complete